MPIRMNTFAKIITLIVLLLIPILFLYSLSNRVSVSVLREEIQSMKQKDLAYLANELDSTTDNLSTMASLLSEDIHIQELQHLNLVETAYERYDEQSRVLERLRLLNVAGRWDTQYSIITPQLGKIVSTNPSSTLDIEALARIITPSWKIREMNMGNMKKQRFVRHIIKPSFTIQDINKAGLIVEVSFPKEHLIKELDTFKVGGKGDPFLFFPEGNLITNRTAELDNITELVRRMESDGIQPFVARTVELQGKQYVVNAMEIRSLDGYLVDYVPLEETLQPIIQSRNLFYASVGLLLLMSLLAGYLLYRNVQRPIRWLVRGVQRMKIGDYSARITGNPNNEFTFLIQRFNEMASETQRLIQTVYVEQLRAREANLKQLQSQINPHFLYNCFALIRSLSRLGKRQSVMDLAMHLSKYYRYTARVEKTTASLREELLLIESYLEIQKLHIPHLSYTIDMPEMMLELEVPRLLLQPIVENAVIHGAELSGHDVTVAIRGEQYDRYHTIIVEDNGVGMTEEQMTELRKNMLLPPNDNTGCALWNIHQRLTLLFGPSASIEPSRREGGGVAVNIQWSNVQQPKEKEV